MKSAKTTIHRSNYENIEKFEIFIFKKQVHCYLVDQADVFDSMTQTTLSVSEVQLGKPQLQMPVKPPPMTVERNVAVLLVKKVVIRWPDI